jgi:hypothetical protein
MGFLIDMVGQKHGRLTVVARAPNQETRAAWNCVCECGNKVVVDGKKLRTGHTKSCGCYRTEVSCPAQGKANTKHGQSYTKGYRRFHSRLREIAEIRQRPKWADMAKIREIYVNRPEDCHVDLPIKENMKKHNTYKGVDSWHSS